MKRYPPPPPSPPPLRRVHLTGVVSTVVITTVVLEGWSTKLDPDIRVLELLSSVLPGRWQERLGGAVDRMMGGPDSSALVIG
jgi:hypothetical protein